MEFDLNDQPKVETPLELALRRREEKLMRKKRKECAIVRDKHELAMARKRNEVLEKRWNAVQREQGEVVGSK